MLLLIKNISAKEAHGIAWNTHAKRVRYPLPVSSLHPMLLLFFPNVFAITSTHVYLGLPLFLIRVYFRLAYSSIASFIRLSNHFINIISAAKKNHAAFLSEFSPYGFGE